MQAPVFTSHLADFQGSPSSDTLEFKDLSTRTMHSPKVKRHSSTPLEYMQSFFTFQEKPYP